MKYFDYDAYIKQLEEIVSIDSGSFDPEGVDKVAEIMARSVSTNGLASVWRLKTFRMRRR